MQNALSRISLWLTLSAFICLLPGSLSAQIKLFPEQPVTGQQTKILVLNDRRADSDVTWSFQPLSDSNAAAATVPDPMTGRDSLGSVTFNRPGEFLILAEIRNPDDSVKTISQKVVVSSSAGASESGAADVLATRDEVRSDLGLVEFTRNQMLSNETLVDELDQRFLESCEAIAQVYESLAEEAPPHNLTDESEAAIEQEVLFLKKTSAAITQKLEELHPAWERFRRLNAGRKSPGEKAWDAYRNNFVDKLNELADTADDEFKMKYSYKQAWLEFAQGLREALATKTEYIKTYNQSRQIYEAYMRNNPGSSGDRRRDRRPRCPLLIRLGLF